MMTAFRTFWAPSAGSQLRLVLAGLLFLFALACRPAFADDKAQLLATAENGYARLVLTFPDRVDLPGYKLRAENGVLAIDFDAPVDLLLPDMASSLPDYVSVARVNPDRRGIRVGLQTVLTVNRMEAGEQLYIDLLPANWRGLPPVLPPQVVAKLAQRAKTAAINADQKRRAEEAKLVHPVATLRVGRNPTFLRAQFDWNVDTGGKFAVVDQNGNLTFDWPVPIDLYALKSNLPPELLDAQNAVTPAGSQVVFHVAKGVTPRFYATSTRQFIVDIDTANSIPQGVTAEALIAAKSREDAARLKEADSNVPPPIDHGQPDKIDISAHVSQAPQTSITPYGIQVGSTVRVVFPFNEDTPAAVFRRGDIVWMLFDTATGIAQPAKSDALSSVVSKFTSVPAGSTQVVRMDLSQDKLATLGTEGQSWVLSLGDTLLSPTEALTLSRRQKDNGNFQITANMQRPSRIHQFRDPVVGDLLTVVTGFPPARGLTRNLEYVDFSGLTSINGLVVKPQVDPLDVTIEDKLAVIEAPDGLTVSSTAPPTVLDVGKDASQRGGFIDLVTAEEADPTKIPAQQARLMDSAATGDGQLRDRARLDLARFYLANQLAYEAIGVVRVAQPDIKADVTKKEANLTLAIADTMAARPSDALALLNSQAFANQSDPLVWRTIAKSDTYDFKGALRDAKASEGIIPGYPLWARTRFLFSAARAAVETGDPDGAQHFLKMIEFGKLSPEETSLHQLLTGRIAELGNRTNEAIDTYGQVINADVRPYRAEAVYRTLLLLNKSGKIDLAKATSTLAAEALLWRGNPLEADMQKLLAELYFRTGSYRQGFETVKQASAYYPENGPINQLLDEAKTQFNDLFLNAKADTLSPVDALSLYYDFRTLTPPGAQGDEMIRNLARRLVKVDLLGQAADLLQYQIDNRLTGAAQAQVAADLAIIDIANRKPEAALLALNKTSTAELPPALQRQRRVLEARALIDAGREDLALDLVSTLSGRDVDLLRVDANWTAKRYGPASELLETLYAPVDAADPMSQPARLNIIKAAVGYVLAGDTLGLSRIRAKFADPMSKSAEWPVFDFVTGQVDVTSTQFKQIVRQVSGLDSISAFLAAYKQVYSGNGSMTPLTAAKPGA